MQAIQIKLTQYLFAAVCRQAVLPHCNLQRLVAKSFCRKYTLQQPLSKSFGYAALCIAPKPFGAKIIRRRSGLKPKVFGPLQFAAPSLKKNR